SQHMSDSPFASIEAAIDDFREGRMVVIVDDEDRENEGDVCVAAQHITDEQITFMAIEARGLICLTLAPERIDQLQLPLQAPNNKAGFETAFTVSIEAAEGVTTGISAADRAHTIRVAAKPDAKPSDLDRPGHVFPLRAKSNGVLERTGQTEGSVDLAKLAGLEPAAVICEVMNDDGTMARVSDLIGFCETHNLNMISIKDMVEYRRRTETQVERVAETNVPTAHGEFVTYGYRDTVDGTQYVALVKGDVSGDDVIVRVHSSCITGDVFGSKRCDCGEQLHNSLQLIETTGRGVVVYLEQEGRGIGIVEKLRAYELQDQGYDTLEANTKLGHPIDTRDYYAASQILRDLDVRSIRLLTNNPDKVASLETYGTVVNERVALETHPNETNRGYLQTKRDRLGHILEHADLGAATGLERAKERALAR
ncbi:MAG: 3,4-dihydroxy-2-butanone 4-phosphate synthase, partial [Thermoleophilia bacterium]|nr:3,4-dihydroxy-2-butanone 4-phosphate synthase [Thermoleophilia bacterium]